MAIVVSISCDTLNPMAKTVDDTSPVINAKARYWSRIAIFAYTTSIRRPSYGNIVITIGMETLEWCGYHMVKKF